MSPKLHLLSYITLSCVSLQAQTVLQGTVKGTDSEPIPGASIVCLSLPDSIYINGTVSDVEGRFLLTEKPSGGRHLLSVQASGYERHYQCVETSATASIDIRLEPVSTQLAEIVVSAKAPSTTRQGGKFIFIPNGLADNVPNARELMAHVPLVKWTDKKVEIEGRGLSKIYINGKDPHWQPEEVSAKLRTLDPHCVRRVEIITDPGSSQSASFSGGIVNIVYDDPTQGFVGNAALSLTMANDRPAVSPNLWMAFQKGRFRTSANLHHSFESSMARTTNSYEYPLLGKSVINETYSHSHAHRLFLSLNMNYDLTPKSTIGLSLYAGSAASKATDKVSTVTSQDGSRLHSYMANKTVMPMWSPNPSGVLYYTLVTDDRGSNFSAEVEYGVSKTKNENMRDFSGTVSPQDFTYSGEALNANAKYKHIFNAKTSLHAGVGYEYTHRTQTQRLDGETSDFTYDDGVSSGFVQFSRTWNDIFSSDIGLRVEHTHVRTLSSTEAQSGTQDYTDLFPSLSLSWRIPVAGQSISLSYSKHISRPRLYFLDPYKTWTSDNSYYQGNPDLKANKTHFVNMSYKFLNDFIFQAMYMYSGTSTTQYTINTPDGMSVSSVTNAGHSNYVLLSLNYNAMPTSFWILGTSANAVYRNEKVRTPASTLSASGWEVGAWSLSNTFVLSRKHSLRMSLSNSLMPPHSKAVYSTGWRDDLSVALDKSFDFGLVAQLSCWIPFGLKNTQHLHTPEYSYDIVTHGGQYSITLNLSYTFGKSQVKGPKEKASAITL